MTSELWRDRRSTRSVQAELAALARPEYAVPPAVAQSPRWLNLKPLASELGWLRPSGLSAVQEATRIATSERPPSSECC